MYWYLKTKILKGSKWSRELHTFMCMLFTTDSEHNLLSQHIVATTKQPHNVVPP